MRRRTKPRVVWLPNTNANSIGNGSQVYQAATVTFGPATGDTGSIELPIVIDGEPDPLGAGQTLSDVENSGYRLRRIVGKIWVIGGQASFDGAGPPAYIVTAGFMVRRTNPTTGASLAVLADNGPPFPSIDPGQIENIGDPWIWRRSWLLGDNSSSAANPASPLPTRNFGDDYGGGISEGPHVDQKTARIVSSEERLFLDVTATTLIDGQLAPPSLGALFVATDIRVLASMRTSTGNRRNASR